MSYTIEVLPDQPVIITTYDGFISAEELIISQQNILDTMQEMGLKHIYAIQNVQRATTSFVDIITNVKAFRSIRNKSEAANQTETVLVFVGSKMFLSLITGLFGNKQYGGYRVVSFREMDDALRFVELELTSKR